MKNIINKTRTLTLLIVASVLSAFMFSACKHEVLVPTSPVISFATDVQPILIANCTQSRCHTSGNGGEERAFALSTYSQVMSRGRISPGNPNGSSIYTAITSGKMPKSPYPTVPNEQVLKLYVWILQGAKNN